MTSVSKNEYIDKLDDIVNKYNHTYHSTIKMKSADVNSSAYVDFGVKNNDNDPKFMVGNHVRISNIKIFLQKIVFKIGLKKCL